MLDRITEQPFCQTSVSGSTFVNADCFDVFPFIEDKSIDAIIWDRKGKTILRYCCSEGFGVLWLTDGAMRSVLLVEIIKLPKKLMQN